MSDQHHAIDRRALLANHRPIFDRTDAKRAYFCDVFFEQLHGGLAAPRRVAYWYSLFSHRRDDLTCKVYLRFPSRLKLIPTRGTA